MDARLQDMATAFMPLPESFFVGSTPRIAKRLLGKLLVSDSPEGRTAGRIVETEAYLATGDPGCHAARGKTARNAPMFERPGTIYVYKIYGIHYCINIVTQPAGIPEAVLIRALEPVEGLQLMRRRRGVDSTKELCSGPAKLCQALGIGPQHNWGHVTRGPLMVVDCNDPPRPIVTTTRIGLGPNRGDNLKLRYYFADSDHVSKR